MTDRFCNLTLSRADWNQMASVLSRSRDATCVGAASFIRQTLSENDAAAISIYREAEKWARVIGRAEATAAPGEGAFLKRAIPQVSAAIFTEVE